MRVDLHLSRKGRAIYENLEQARNKVQAIFNSSVRGLEVPKGVGKKSRPEGRDASRKCRGGERKTATLLLNQGKGSPNRSNTTTVARREDSGAREKESNVNRQRGGGENCGNGYPSIGTVTTSTAIRE